MGRASGPSRPFDDNDDGDPLISSFRYTLRDDGRREQAIETFPGLAPEATFPLVQHFVWQYDNAGRLIGETLDFGPGKDNEDLVYREQDYVDTFQYDLVDNRLEYKRVDPVYPTSVYFTTVYDYDANDRLISESKDAYDQDDDRYIEYTYNVTQQTGKNVHERAITQSATIDQIVVNSYNLQGRLSEVDIDPDGENGMAAHVITKYKYDDNGFRVHTDVDGTVTHYLVDANNHTGHTQVLEELGDTGDVLTTFLLGHDVLAQHDATHGQVYLIADGHGSTRQLIDTVGNIVTPTGGATQFFTYTAYGEAHGFDQSQAVTAMLYTGEWYEHSTGWQYNRERWYDPSTGRWSRRDPILGSFSDPISLHKYLYANGDPVQFIDPTGRYSITTTLGAIGIGLNIASFSFNFTQANLAASRGDTAEAAEHTTWAMIDLLFLGIPFVGPGAQGGKFALQSARGATVAAPALQLSRSGVKASAIWVYLTTLAGVQDQLGGNFTFASGSGTAQSGPQVGSSLGGPGKVVGEAGGMRDPAAGFQLQAGGLPRGFAYRVNGINFDGFLNGLIEAKGLGYAKLLRDPKIAEQVARQVLIQAGRQLEAAGKTAIRWVVAEEDFARAVRTLFERESISIKVIHQAPRFPLNP